MTPLVTRPPLGPPRITVDDIIILEPTNDVTGRVRKYPRADSPCIGTGSYGDVYAGIMDFGRPTQLKVVIKIIRGVHTDPEALEQYKRRLKREVVVWRPLRHPHIARFLGIAHGFGPSPGLVSPHVEWNLMCFIEENPVERRRLIREIAEGMQYLHEHGVVHGDLKADNIRVSARGQAKIIDFGISQIVNISGFTTKIERNARYTAPELMPIHEEETVTGEAVLQVRPTSASDSFSFGILLLQMRHGRIRDHRDVPYNHLRQFGNDSHVIRKVHEGDRPRRRQYSRSISDDDWYLICQCWQHNPDDRLSMEEVLQFLRH